MIDGPQVQVNRQIITPALPIESTIITPGKTGIVREIATFPAGTNLIMMQPTTISQFLPYIVVDVSTLVGSFSLIDDKGEMWHITGTGGTLYRHLAYLNIDCIGRRAYYYSSSVAGRQVLTIRVLLIIKQYHLILLLILSIF